MPVVSIAEIDAALRLDLQDDGNSPPSYIDSRLTEVEMRLAQAEDIVREYLKIDPTSWPPEEITDRLKASIILAFHGLFDERSEWIEGLQKTPAEGPVAALLRLDRVPTLA